MELSIIIPTKDRGYIFKETLAAACSAIEGHHAQILVVNDSKTSVPEITHNDARVRLLTNEKSGVAAARNLGAANATGDLLLFIDDDIVISKQSVEHILQLHKQYQQACFNVNWEYSPATAAKIMDDHFGRFLEAHQMITFRGWYNDPSWRDNELFRSNSVASFHLSIKKNDFQRSGGYNEQFPHAGFEDYDFPKQLKKIGLEFYIDTRVTVYHNEVDRLNLDNWLNSQERRSVTRARAVQLGYQELRLQYGFLKKLMLRIILLLQPLLRLVLRQLPNRTFFDPLYFKVVSILQASRIFKGYTSP